MEQSPRTYRRTSGDYSRQRHQGTITGSLLGCLNTMTSAFQELREQLPVTTQGPTTTEHRRHEGQSATSPSGANWTRDGENQRVRDGTSESCSNHGSDCNDREQDKRARREQYRGSTEGRSTTFCRRTNWVRDEQARRGGRERIHPRDRLETRRTRSRS